MKSLRDVRIVAWLFILSGVFSVVGMFQGGKIAISTGVLAIPTGIGLLRFSSGWRTFALVCLWLTMIGLPLAALGLLTSSNFVMDLFGTQSHSRVLGTGIATLGFVVAFWQYRVLKRFDVRRWFDVGEASVA